MTADFVMYDSVVLFIFVLECGTRLSGKIRVHLVSCQPYVTLT